MCSKWYGKCSCDFEVNQTKIKGGCQSRGKVVTHNSKSDLPLIHSQLDQNPLYLALFLPTLYTTLSAELLINYFFFYFFHSISFGKF